MLHTFRKRLCELYENVISLLPSKVLFILQKVLLKQNTPLYSHGFASWLLAHVLSSSLTLSPSWSSIYSMRLVQQLSLRQIGFISKTWFVVV